MSLLEETVNDAEFILEAISENLEAKKDMFESKFPSNNDVVNCKEHET